MLTGKYPKSEIVVEYAQKYNLDTLVETGTYHGDMLMEVHEYFKKIYTVEIKQENYDFAVDALDHAGVKNVSFYLGDSVQILPDILSELKSPALFWLDAHWYGNTPLRQELNLFQNHREAGHILLIDDVREFILYAITVSDIQKMFPNKTVENKDDVLRIF